MKFSVAALLALPALAAAIPFEARQDGASICANLTLCCADVLDVSLNTCPQFDDDTDNITQTGRYFTHWNHRSPRYRSHHLHRTRRYRMQRGRLSQSSLQLESRVLPPREFFYPRASQALTDTRVRARRLSASTASHFRLFRDESQFFLLENPVIRV